MLELAKELLYVFEKRFPVSAFKFSTAPDGKWDTNRVVITGQFGDGRKLELTLTEELPDAN